MTREKSNNYLLGYGERLATAVEIRKGSRPKNPPYTFEYAKERLEPKIAEAENNFLALPKLARPDDQVVGVVTMHPRFVSKSDQPENLFDRIGLYSIGSRPARVTPENWGVPSMEGKTDAITDEIFVAGKIDAFTHWRETIKEWSLEYPFEDVIKLERVYSYSAEDKVKGTFSEGVEKIAFEVVLQHGLYGGDIYIKFLEYLEEINASASIKRRREVGGLTFIPVIANPKQALDIAAFSFVRVARAMPELRPIEVLQPLRKVRRAAALPDSDAQDLKSRVVIFDGGIPEGHPMRRWVNCIEPPNIGAAVPAFQEHGISVTSAFLFGKLDDEGGAIPPPLSNVDHVRILDEQDGSGIDFTYTDALSRILDHLDSDPSIEFVNLSVGPRYAVNDNEVTAWTAQLDERFASQERMAVVAAGNDGEIEDEQGGYRVQPPSDGINMLSVGALDQNIGEWKRAAYSCRGPGRSPGIVKPDGVSFGGSTLEPFQVLNSRNQIVGVQGTSFAAPFTLRQAVAVKAQLGNRLNTLAVRGLLVHRAENPHKYAIEEVGWGMFETDPYAQITCSDDEAIIVYQGMLNPSQYLRAFIPLPNKRLAGKVKIRATLITTPETDPAFATAYSRNGTEVFFRPDINDFTINEKTGNPTPPKTKSFFSLGKLRFESETELRKMAQKWESCMRGEISIDASKLDSPHFDIYYHHRYQGGKHPNPKQLPYSLIVSIQSPGNISLYNDIVSTFNQQLVPLNPQVRIKV